MNSPAKDIKDILVAEGSLGLTFATNLFTNKEPALPKNCVTIFNTSGFAPALGLTDQGYEYPSIQIRVRNTSEPNAWTLIESIKSKLHGLHQETWNGTLYSVIYCSSGPALLDWDDNGNCRLVMNLNIQRRADVSVFINPPTLFSVTVISDTQIDLAWTNNSLNQAVAIERSLNGNDFTEIIRTSAWDDDYSNTGLIEGTRYYYRMRAFSGGDYSAYTNVEDATTSYWVQLNYITVLSALTISGTTQTITATIVGSDYDGVSFEYSSDEGQSFAEHGTSLTGVYNATGLTPVTSYIWRARLFKGISYGDYFAFAYASTIFLTDSLLGYWPLDEASGDAIDEISNLVLTNNNTATYTAGLVNNCVTFGTGNTNKSLYLNNKLGMTYNSSKSIAFRVKINAAPASTKIYNLASVYINTNPGNYLTCLYTNASGVYKLGMTTLTGGISSYYIKTLTVGTWYHIVVVQDNIHSHNFLYVDGILCLTTDLMGTNDKTAQAGGIYAGQIIGVNFSNACIDELQVFGTALTEGEVSLLNSTLPLTIPLSIPESGIKVMSDVSYSFVASVHSIYDSVYKKTIFGVLHNTGDGNYDTYLLQLDQNTNIFSRTLINTNPGIDDEHNEPSILIRSSDKKVIVVYRKYAENQLGIKISTNPCDISSFGDEIVLQPCGNVYHYFPVLHEVVNGDIYLFYHYTDAENHSAIGFIKSIDGGINWSANTKLMDDSVSWYYFWTYQDSNNKNLIHFLQSPNPNSLKNPDKISHLYFNAGTETWHDSAGTDITANIPFDFNDGTTIHSVASPSQLWGENIIVDSNGYPRVLFTYFDNYTTTPTRKYQMYSEWDGSAWTTPLQLHESCYKNIGVDAEVNNYMPLATFDKLNPDCIFASKEISVGGQLEMYLLTRIASDTFTSEKKSTSLNDQWRPVSVPSAKFNVFRLNKKYYNHYNGPFNQDLIIDTI